MAYYDVPRRPPPEPDAGDVLGTAIGSLSTMFVAFALVPLRDHVPNENIAPYLSCRCWERSSAVAPPACRRRSLPRCRSTSGTAVHVAAHYERGRRHDVRRTRDCQPDRCRVGNPGSPRWTRTPVAPRSTACTASPRCRPAARTSTMSCRQPAPSSSDFSGSSTACTNPGPPHAPPARRTARRIRARRAGRRRRLLLPTGGVEIPIEARAHLRPLGADRRPRDAGTARKAARRGGDRRRARADVRGTPGRGA